jgi:D-alanine-D-alanine ligase
VLGPLGEAGCGQLVEHGESGRAGDRVAAVRAAETADVQAVASRAYEALGCTGFARVDLILDADAAPQVLEANAIPGLTDTSLFPMAADAAGIGFEDLVARIVDLARRRSTTVA